MNVQRMADPNVLVAQPVSTPVPETAAATPEVGAKPQAGFWQQRVVQNVVPFFSSLTVHASIILLGALTLKVVQVATRPNTETMTEQAESGLKDLTPGVDVVQMIKGPANVDYDSAQDQDATATDHGWNTVKDTNKNSFVAGEEGSGKEADNGLISFCGPMKGIGGHGPGVGDGGKGGIQAPFGVPRIGGSRGGEIGIFTNPPRLVKSVAYVCDASGSMLNNFDDLRNQISKSINLLKPVQSFNVIFFQGETAASASKSSLIPAFPENKRKTQLFLDDIAPSSTTDPIPALELAFKQKPELIWLLTDGDFPDNHAVLDFIRRHNADKRIQVNTIAFVNRGDEYERVLKTIAEENRGEFKYVNEETLAR